MASSGPDLNTKPALKISPLAAALKAREGGNFSQSSIEDIRNNKNNLGDLWSDYTAWLDRNDPANLPGSKMNSLLASQGQGTQIPNADAQELRSFLADFSNRTTETEVWLKTLDNTPLGNIKDILASSIPDMETGGFDLYMKGLAMRDPASLPALKNQVTALQNAGRSREAIEEFEYADKIISKFFSRFAEHTTAEERDYLLSNSDPVERQNLIQNIMGRTEQSTWEMVKTDMADLASSVGGRAAGIVGRIGGYALRAATQRSTPGGGTAPRRIIAPIMGNITERVSQSLERSAQSFLPEVQLINNAISARQARLGEMDSAVQGFVSVFGAQDMRGGIFEKMPLIIQERMKNSPPEIAPMTQEVIREKTSVVGVANELASRIGTAAVDFLKSERGKGTPNATIWSMPLGGVAGQPTYNDAFQGVADKIRTEADSRGFVSTLLQAIWDALIGRKVTSDRTKNGVIDFLTK